VQATEAIFQLSRWGLPSGPLASSHNATLWTLFGNCDPGGTRQGSPPCLFHPVTRTLKPFPVVDRNGDTITVLDASNQQHRIRLYGTDEAAVRRSAGSHDRSGKCGVAAVGVGPCQAFDKDGSNSVGSKKVVRQKSAHACALPARTSIKR